MKLLKQPNRWSCLPTSFAMVLNVNIEVIFQFIGHDGSEILWPDKDEPAKRRSFHMQEMIEFCLFCGYSCTELDVHPKSINQPDQAFDDLEKALEEDDLFAARKAWSLLKGEILSIPPIRDFTDYLSDYSAVILGLSKKDTLHAVAWNNELGLIFDPNGTKYPLQDFRVESILLVSKIENKSESGIDWN